jgi:hypothetical protein
VVTRYDQLPRDGRRRLEQLVQARFLAPDQVTRAARREEHHLEAHSFQVTVFRSAGVCATHD